MSGPRKPKPPTIPEGIHRTEASQEEVDRRLADHARGERQKRLAEDTGPQRVSTLLGQLVYTQERLVDLQTEQTRVLHAILEAVSVQRG